MLLKFFSDKSSSEVKIKKHF